MALSWHWIPEQWGMTAGNAYVRALGTQRPVHELVAREVIQNSWDAAQRHRDEHRGKSGLDVDKEKFKMVFEFQEFTGKEKKRILQAIQAKELKSKLDSAGHEKLRLPEGKTILDHLNDDEPLKALYIHDYGATGLKGNPSGNDLSKSDFFRAFGDLGGNDRAIGGGSYGFGKSAFIKSSKINCVVAYSSFFAAEEDPETRRLWGFVYWPKFQDLVGVAQLGLLNQDSGVKSIPAEGKLADQLAEDFGFHIRNSKTFESCGTSLLILDHSLDPELLQESIEKYWWPAFESFPSTFDITIISKDGAKRPQPRANPKYRPFIRAFEIASDPQSVLVEGEWKPDWRAVRDLGISAGSMGLINVVGEQDDLEIFKSFSQIALIREPRMVVEYQPQPGGNQSTAIKGTFIASPQADPFLRMSEPATHDNWQEGMDSTAGLDWEKARDVVKSVQARIRRAVIDFQNALRKQHKPKPGRLNFASELLAGLLTDPIPRGSSARTTLNRQKKKKKKEASLYISTLKYTRRDLEPNGISVKEIWEIKLPDAITEPKTCKITFSAWVISETGETTAADKINTSLVKIPQNFKALPDGSYIGTITPQSIYELEFKTQPYNQNWNLKTDLNLDFSIKRFEESK